uniref:CREB regulated transcription coactivator 2 n=1 Tax=Sander lucioperca TaxID=283035 RepID=A0A8C9ZXB9_SANLU
MTCVKEKKRIECVIVPSTSGNVLPNASLSPGVPLDTSKLPLDQRLPPYPLSQSHQHQPGSHQPLPGLQGSQPGQQPSHMSQHHHQQLHRLQQQQQTHCGGSDKNQFPSDSGGHLDLQDPGDQQVLNHQNQNYGGGDARHNVPNIILTGDSPPGLSKEIASALSHDSFRSDRLK